MNEEKRIRAGSIYMGDDEKLPPRTRIPKSAYPQRR